MNEGTRIMFSTTRGTLRESSSENKYFDTKLLLEAGHDPNEGVNKEGFIYSELWSCWTHYTALGFAVENGNFDLVELLLEYGANINAALLSVDLNSKYALLMSEFLIEAGANINIRPLVPDNNFLGKCLNKGNVEIVKLLIEKGVRVNNLESENFDMSPISIACCFCPGSIELLLDSGADPSLNGYGDSNAFDYLREPASNISIKNILISRELFRNRGLFGVVQ